SRLKTGLDRLRAALADDTPNWRAILAVGATVKTKTSYIAALLLLLFLGIAAFVYSRRDREPDAATPVATPTKPAPKLMPQPKGHVEQPVANPRPGQGRASVDAIDLAGGTVTGRVINWSTGDGVAGADLTFVGPGGAVTVRSHADG